MNKYKKAILTSFNQYPRQDCILHRPERYHALLQAGKPLIPRGSGRSYGDAALNAQGHVVSLERLNRFISFDPELGLLKAEAGISLSEILSLTIPKGWFLPVTPGTQYATLGGCIAADVHGKNHLQAGSFGNHILDLELITVESTVQCSPTQNSDIFWATVGGMGLTGIIGTATIQLQPIKTAYFSVVYNTAKDLPSSLELLANSSAPYNVVWIDLLA